MPRKKRCKVFVSYSRHDEELVKPLAGLLGVAANDAVFLDVTSIKPGEVWKSEIETALRQAPVFVLCWCCESQKSEFVAYEIKTAMACGEKRLVPVLFCSTPLPPPMADRQWIDLRGRIVHACGDHNLGITGDDDLGATGEHVLGGYYDGEIGSQSERHRPAPRLSPKQSFRTVWIAAALGFLMTVIVGFF